MSALASAATNAAQRTPRPASIQTKARRDGNFWKGYFRFGGYWFPVERRGKVLTFVSAAAARAAASRAAPSVTRGTAS